MAANEPVITFVEARILKEMTGKTGTEYLFSMLKSAFKLNFFNKLRRHSAHNRITWHIFRHHRTRSYN